MNIYPQTITPKEKEVGFQKIQIDSGYEAIFGGPEMWDVYAKKFSKSDYLFKTGEKEYRQMRYGHRRSDKSKNPNWHPIGDVFESESDALQKLTLEDLDFKIIVGQNFGE